MSIRRNDKKLEQEERLKSLIAERHEILAELSDGRGEIVKEAIRQFIDRVEALIASDPECQIYDKLLGRIGMKLKIGEKIVRSRFPDLPL